MTIWLTLFITLVSSRSAFAEAYRVTEANGTEGILSAQNLMRNGEFEKKTLNWTASGGATTTVTSTSANVGRGIYAYDWDSNGASQTLLSASVTIPAGMYGRNGVVSCLFKNSGSNPSSTAVTHTIGAYDGSNALSATTITSSSTFTRSSSNFIFPSSGSIQLQIASVSATEPEIYIDDCYLGLSEGFNAYQVSQASFVGSAYMANTTNCRPTRANTAVGAFGTDSDCPGPTVEFNPGPGTIQTTDADLPNFTVNNLPPGYYRVMLEAAVFGSSSIHAAFAVSDGTTTTGQHDFDLTTAALSVSVVGYFNYTTTASRTFSLHTGSASGTVTLDLNGTSPTGSGLRFSIERWPSAPETGYRPDQSPASWSGYHSTDCGTWTRNNAAYGDPAVDTACTLTEVANRNFGAVTSYLSGSDKLPGITFAPPRVGFYYVCAIPVLNSTVSFNQVSARLWDGTTTIAEGARRAYTDGASTDYLSLPLCGIYNATSTASKSLRIQIASSSGTVTMGAAALGVARGTIEWSIFQLDAAFPAPLLVGSVTSNSSGMERIERATFTNSGSCAVSKQSGSWISSVSDPGLGQCGITIASGIFSDTPSCVVTVENAASRIAMINVASATSATVYTYNDAGTAEDRGFHIHCMGAR